MLKQWLSDFIDILTVLEAWQAFSQPPMTNRKNFSEKAQSSVSKMLVTAKRSCISVLNNQPLMYWTRAKYIKGVSLATYGHLRRAQ